MTESSSLTSSNSAVITSQDYAEFSQFLLNSCGIDLGVGKEYLVSTRVRKILAQHNFSCLAELVASMRSSSKSSLRQQVVDAMTTNETLWFRDAYPFEYLKNTLLPKLQKGQFTNKPLKVWSAACSSGQEPYSIGMIVDEFNQRSRQARIDVRISATDISNTILERAKAGVYDRLSIARGLSQQRLQAYFLPKDELLWQVKPALQNCVQFRQLNLQNDTFGYEQYDLVFCRNVLIYFNAALKLRILSKIHAVLAPGGLLFLGASESVSGAEKLFEVVNCHPGIAYRKR